MLMSDHEFKEKLISNGIDDEDQLKSIFKDKISALTYQMVFVAGEKNQIKNDLKDLKE